PHGLHERVADRRADELEAAPPQLLRHGAALVGLGGYLAGVAKAVDARTPAHEPPEEVREARLLPQGQVGACVGDRGLDLGAVADDAGVPQEALDARRPPARDLLGDEPVEGAAKRLALA